MAYCSASNVFSYVKNLIRGEVRFSEDSDPTLNEITWYMSTGCATIHTELSKNGWTVPAASGTALYDKLSDLNALYAAARAELSRVNVTVQPGERTRGQVYLQMFENDLTKLVESDLADIGGELSTSDAEIYLGGVSEDNKDTYYDNTDRVPNRFRRSQFKFGESSYPED